MSTLLLFALVVLAHVVGELSCMHKHLADISKPSVSTCSARAIAWIMTAYILITPLYARGYERTLAHTCSVSHGVSEMLCQASKNTTKKHPWHRS